MTPDINPCPACRSKALGIYRDAMVHRDGNDELYRIFCQKCGYEGEEYGSIEEAVDHWNEDHDIRIAPCPFCHAKNITPRWHANLNRWLMDGHDIGCVLDGAVYPYHLSRTQLIARWNKR